MTSASLQAITVTVEHASGNVEPLLHQIRHALDILLREGTSTCIDLLALPLAPGEEERMRALLGSGEVRAEVTALGRSEIAETAYPGVWLVSHHDERGELLTRFIEITHVPEFLRAQPDDIRCALERLTARLSLTSLGAR
jgi:hydrogenase-1 operon protein HyaF